MPPCNGQAELFGLLWLSSQYPFRLRAGDVFRMNRPVRVCKTRFDKPVRFQPSPLVFRISPNAEVEILNRKPNKHGPRERRRV